MVICYIEYNLFLRRVRQSSCILDDNVIAILLLKLYPFESRCLLHHKAPSHEPAALGLTSKSSWLMGL